MIFGICPIRFQNWKSGCWIRQSRYRRANMLSIGFDIRPDACGGGAVIDSKLMKIMADNGFDLYLSEYPNSIDDE